MASFIFLINSTVFVTKEEMTFLNLHFFISLNKKFLTLDRNLPLKDYERSKK